MKISKAHATWRGTLKKGEGHAEIPSLGQKVRYSFKSRFEDGSGTNPEELIATAHAQCFSMAFAGILEQNGYDPKSITTTGHVGLDNTNGGFAIARSELHCEAEVEGIGAEEFQTLAEKAKSECPVSRALAISDISVKATLL